MNSRRQRSFSWLHLAGFALLVVIVWWTGRPPALPELDSPGDLSPALPSPAVPAAFQMASTQGASLNGSWVGNLTLGTTQSRFRFQLQESNGQLSGSVDFPVGSGIVQAGTVEGGAINLVTLNQVANGGPPLLTRFIGRQAGDRLDLVMQTEAGDVSLTLYRTP